MEAGSQEGQSYRQTFKLLTSIFQSSQYPSTITLFLAIRVQLFETPLKINPHFLYLPILQTLNQAALPSVSNIAQKGLKRHQYIIFYQILLLMNTSPSLKDFSILSVIGKGTYAKVLLVRHLKDNQLYALKVLKKKYILQKNQEKHIMTEKEILAAIEHPFLVKLKMSFQDQRKLYFLLQYCPGGELFSLLAAKDKLTEDQAKFYCAQIVLALEALHRQKVIYRDLKPENIIIDRVGYVKLTDFGLSKILENEETANSICGTPEYLAPEIVKKMGHGVDVDWWCLGCLLHEMITGFPPFRSENRMELFESIVYKNPDLSKFSPKLQDLLKRLLQKDPSKRLGHGSAKQIKDHPWFQKLNWQAVINKKIKAPFIPKLSSDIDITNFDVEFTSCSVQSQGDKSPGDEASQKFKDFSYE